MNKAIHALGHKFKRRKLNRSLPNTAASIPAQDKNRTCDRCLALWSKVPFYEDDEDICILEETTEFRIELSDMPDTWSNDAGMSGGNAELD
jgi:hypothetical protein